MTEEGRTAPIPVPDPPLTDGVVRLRLWSMDDAPAVQVAVHDPEIPRFMGIPRNHTLEGVQRWLSSRPEGWETGASASFAIVDAADGTLLGSVGADRSCDDPEIAEIGYWVAAEARGRGVATRAVRLVAAWAFEALRVTRLEITTHEDNEPSRRAALSAGFPREGVLRGYREHAGSRVDLVMFARLSTD